MPSLPVTPGQAGASVWSALVDSASPRLGTFHRQPPAVRDLQRLLKAQAATGRRLDELAGIGARVLHDRHTPPGREQLPHMVVTPGAVAVVFDLVAPRGARSWSTSGHDFCTADQRNPDAFAQPVRWSLRLSLLVAIHLPGWTLPVLPFAVLHGVRQAGAVSIPQATPLTNQDCVVGNLAAVTAAIARQTRCLGPEHVAELAGVLDHALPPLPLHIDLAERIGRSDDQDPDSTPRSAKKDSQ